MLLPLYYQNGEPYLLFTRRTELVHHHKGEISFPGGGYSPEDGSLSNTALRESFEEIGLRPQDVEILGEMDDMLTRGSNYIITPFVGSILPDYKFKPSSYEIAEIIRIPLAALMEKDCRREEPLIRLGDQLVVPYVYVYGEKKIIGATARILKQFLEIYSEATGLRLA